MMAELAINESHIWTNPSGTCTTATTATKCRKSRRYRRKVWSNIWPTDIGSKTCSAMAHLPSVPIAAHNSERAHNIACIHTGVKPGTQLPGGRPLAPVRRWLL